MSPKIRLHHREEEANEEQTVASPGSGYGLPGPVPAGSAFSRGPAALPRHRLRPDPHAAPDQSQPGVVPAALHQRFRSGRRLYRFLRGPGCRRANLVQQDDLRAAGILVHQHRDQHRRHPLPRQGLAGRHQRHDLRLPRLGLGGQQPPTPLLRLRRLGQLDDGLHLHHRQQQPLHDRQRHRLLRLPRRDPAQRHLLRLRGIERRPDDDRQQHDRHRRLARLRQHRRHPGLRRAAPTARIGDPQREFRPPGARPGVRQNLRPGQRLWLLPGDQHGGQTEPPSGGVGGRLHLPRQLDVEQRRHRNDHADDPDHQRDGGT